MSQLSICLACALLACSWPSAAAGASNMESVQVSRSEAAATLLSKLSRPPRAAAAAGAEGAAAAGAGAGAAAAAAADEDERLEQLQRMLGPTFAALPKGANGTLNHEAVRYTLHRLFVQRHGWFIRGLEPHGKRVAEKSPGDEQQEEWVPEYLQALLERRERELGESGTSLSELAALAAALEDLVSREAGQRLEAAWRMHGLPTAGEVDAKSVQDALETYYVAFLNAGNFTADSPEELVAKKRVFAEQYEGWAEAKQWLTETVSPLFGAGPASLESAQRLVPEIGRQYHKVNDRECRDLKGTLKGMEGSKAGRVRLPVFYKTALYSHWRFDEKVDYLRALGALDESDPKQPKVITVNYVMARNNCLESSSLYAICCRNECEDLMGHLEEKIGAPDAEPRRVADLVGNLASDTMPAPRNLSASLLERLQQVAASNGGKVPLHGRLFAQWMHHAYPRECPYPHEAGSINPQTPDEWMRATGHVESSVSAQEMREHVESDTCAAGYDGEAPHDCGDSSPELPWSEAEELLLAPHAKPAAAEAEAADAEVTTAAITEHSAAAGHPRGAVLERDVCALLAVGLLVVGGIAVSLLGFRKVCSSPATGVICLTVLAWSLGLLDGVVFVCAALGGLASVLARVAAARRGLLRVGSKKCCGKGAWPAEPKCCV